MSNDQAQHIIDGETGYRRDLREAELQIVAADGDPVALAKAFNRHAEAVRNMMIAEIIPSFNKVLAPLLDDKLAPVVEGIGGLQTGVTRLNSEFHALTELVSELRLTQIDDSTALHKEVNAVKDDVSALQHAFDHLQTSFINYQAGSRRSEIDEIKAQLAEIHSGYSSEERVKLTSVLLAMIKEYEVAHNG